MTEGDIGGEAKNSREHLDDVVVRVFVVVEENYMIERCEVFAAVWCRPYAGSG